MNKVHSTTVIAVRHNNALAIGADGQATMNAYVVKRNVKKYASCSKAK